jgi:hypothetical protein
MEPYPLVHPTSLAFSFRLRGSTKIVTGASTSVEMNISTQNNYNPIHQTHSKYLCNPVDTLGMTNPTLKFLNEKKIIHTFTKSLKGPVHYGFCKEDIYV